MAWLTMALRRLRDDRVAAAGLVVLVAVTGFVFAVAPRLFVREADRALRDEVAATPASVRNLQLIQERRIGQASGDPLRGVDQAGADLESQIPPAVRALIVDRTYTADTPRWRTTGSTTASLVTMRVQQGIDDRIVYRSGSAPTGRLDPVPLEPGTTSKNATIAYEVALSTATADAMGVKPGDFVPLVLDATDPLARGRSDRAAVKVVGIFDVQDPTAPYWSDDTSVQQPGSVELSANYVLVNAIALLSPDAYPELMSATDASALPLRYSWRYFVDPDRLASGGVDAVQVGLRRLESVFPTSAVVVGAAKGTILRNGLLRFIQGQQARWQSAEAVLTTVAIGPAIVAGAALGLIVLLGSSRRRAGLGLARSRGASPGQVIGATVLEGLTLTIPAALVAISLALLAVPGGVDPATLAIPLVVAVVASALLAAAIVPTATGAPADTGRRAGEGGRGSPRRLVFELLVIGLAIGGAVLLRDRGIRGASSATQLVGADPFIAAVPALAGLAAGLVALRLFRIPVAGLAAIAALRRDLVPVLAMRRTTRSGSAAPILLVLMATASVGAFSLATLAFFDRAGDAVGWQEVGAPFRIVEGSSQLSGDFDPSALPGVSAVARAGATTINGGPQNGVELMALDVADYRSVVQGTPGDLAIPGQMLAPADPAAPVPAIVSTTGVIDGIRPGDAFSLIVEGEPTKLVAVAVRESGPTLPIGGPFVVVDRAQLAAAQPRAAIRTSTIFLRAPDDGAAALRSALAVAEPGVTAESRAERTAAINGTPVVAAVTVGVEAAFAVAIAYAALALLAALALTGAARASESAHLRTLGLGSRQAIGLTIVEHGPTVVLAILLGIAFGLATFLALQPGLGLGAIVGSALAIPLDLSATRFGPLVVAIVAIVSLAMALGIVVRREPASIAALRRGVE